ncbi:hypothetical protein NDU88_005015 [Pleurodeles waltl]|uniref:Uncharacterized protein n=1 Tax=Pleurodeles waltl TaxID=8319 RepID=A0AAV7TU54_PLEWA|nr:hypothetical protein NDU88_005015 [Pleurodeles waltl]
MPCGLGRGEDQHAQQSRRAGGTDHALRRGGKPEAQEPSLVLLGGGAALGIVMARLAGESSHKGIRRLDEGGLQRVRHTRRWEQSAGLTSI